MTEKKNKYKKKFYWPKIILTVFNCPTQTLWNEKQYIGINGFVLDAAGAGGTKAAKLGQTS